MIKRRYQLIAMIALIVALMLPASVALAAPETADAGITTTEFPYKLVKDPDGGSLEPVDTGKESRSSKDRSTVVNQSHTPYRSGDDVCWRGSSSADVTMPQMCITTYLQVWISGNWYYIDGAWRSACCYDCTYLSVTGCDEYPSGYYYRTKSHHWGTFPSSNTYDTWTISSYAYL